MSRMNPSLYNKRRPSVITSPRNTNKLFVRTVIADATELVNSPQIHTPLIEFPEQEDATSSPLLKNKINRKNLEM